MSGICEARVGGNYLHFPIQIQDANFRAGLQLYLQSCMVVQSSSPVIKLLDYTEHFELLTKCGRKTTENESPHKITKGDPFLFTNCMVFRLT